MTEIQDVLRHHVSPSASIKVAIGSFIDKIRDKQVGSQEKYYIISFHIN